MSTRPDTTLLIIKPTESVRIGGGRAMRLTRPLERECAYD